MFSLALWQLINEIAIEKLTEPISNRINQEIEDINISADVTYMNPEVLETLNLMFQSHLPNEYATCLIGKFKWRENKYFITNITATRIHQSNVDSVHHVMCRTDIALHSHPNGVCEMSKRDAFEFGRSVEIVNLKLNCVQCGTGIENIKCWNPQFQVINLTVGEEK